MGRKNDHLNRINNLQVGAAVAFGGLARKKEKGRT
jgi:hypothetical protein